MIIFFFIFYFVVGANVGVPQLFPVILSAIFLLLGSGGTSYAAYFISGLPAGRRAWAF
jgi:hypothetical protein